jgi:hypothetical protein
MQQTTERWRGLDCKGDEDIDGRSIVKGGDESWGGKHWTREVETIRMKRHRRGSGYFFICIYLRSAQEKGSRDNAIHCQGGGISMVHQCGLRPAGGEVSLKYL